MQGFELAPYFVRRVLNNPDRQHLLPHVAVTVNEYEEYEEQDDGKVRYWRFAEELGHHVAVITTGDGALFNAFEDSNYTRKTRRRPS